MNVSPMVKIKLPKIEEKVIVPFTPEHIRVLLRLCKTTTFCGLRNRAMIMVLLDTGIRKKELCCMRVEDLDFDRGIIKVHGKGARERIVGIVTATQKTLLQYLLSRNDNHPCVWVTEERRPLTYDGISVTFRNIAQLIAQGTGKRLACT